MDMRREALWNLVTVGLVMIMILLVIALAPTQTRASRQCSAYPYPSVGYPEPLARCGNVYLPIIVRNH